ncbi:MAG: cysteine desulfurase [Acidobacteria bacterium]|nr:cysteine desulfurase [Acidobacteriota bacterium]MCW5950348.1 cysteine desulfurase [Pyrinomonadaceae bacterium]
MFRRVFLDNSSTTPIDESVLEEMMPYLREDFGNASSIHHYGQVARSAVDRARHRLAALINSRPNEVVFTSGGTESNNLAIRGLAIENRRHGRHIVTTAIEHPAVKMVCEDLESQGFEVNYLAVDAQGIVSADAVKDAIRPDTILVSVMAANNEIGTLQPIDEIGRIVRELRAGGQKIWFHTDAVQAVGKVPVDVNQIGCDLLSLSAHKIHGPKGVGALFVRRGTRLHTQNIGGRQERGLRAGTEPVALVVGLGAAAESAAGSLSISSSRLGGLRDRLESVVGEMIPDIEFNGDRERRLPNISNISFNGVEGEGLLINLDMRGIAVSTGSACSSGTLEPSPVIRALGKGDAIARSAIRFSLGRQNSSDDIERLLAALPEAVEVLRRLGDADPK